MTDRPRIFCIVAARPNFMKVAPLVAAMEERGTLEPVLVHTGQHYDVNMSDVFFRDLGLREPDVHLGIGSGSHAEQTGKLMIAFEALCEKDRPDLVLVVGDVNATVACALVAAKLHIPVAHVEAGLRSGDRRMPEEINRIVTDQLSDLLFTTSREAGVNLQREGVHADKIHFVGNVMVDSLLTHLDKAKSEEVKTRALDDGFRDLPYGVLTMHRPSNVDDADTLRGWVEAFAEISLQLPLVCPLHPRTRQRLEAHGLKDEFEQAVRVLEPMGYHEFLGLMQGARLVVTDSGGLQEETTVLGVPCLTIRENTERPVTIEQGTNELVGIEPAALVKSVHNTIKAPARGQIERPELWDGHAAERIVQVIEGRLNP